MYITKDPIMGSTWGSCCPQAKRRTSETTPTVYILIESARDKVHAELLVGDEPAARLVVGVDPVEESDDDDPDTGGDVGVVTGTDVVGVPVPWVVTSPVIVVPVIGIGSELGVVGRVIVDDPLCSGRLSEIVNSGLALPESPIRTMM